MNPETADFEISIRTPVDGSYPVEVRFRNPGASIETVLPAQSGLVLDSRFLASDPYSRENYGLDLSRKLFSVPGVLTWFHKAEAMAAALSGPLKVRMHILQGAQELYQVAWESLVHPSELDRSTRPWPLRLANDENTRFCRLVGTENWRPVRVRSRIGLRALLVVASPDFLREERDDGLAPIDVQSEIKLAQATFSAADKAVATEVVASPGAATLNNILFHLAEGCDILYLVCHGALRDSKPQLFLDREDRQAIPVSGEEFATRLAGLQTRPTLIVLASCHSAESSAALGPRMAAIGIPAVLAVNQSIRLSTFESFMARFFAEVLRDGEIDRAVAAARAVVSSEPDSWMPVLFLRLRAGRLFEEEDPRLRHWMDELDRLLELGQIAGKEHRSILAWATARDIRAADSRRETAQKLAAAPGVGRRLLWADETDDEFLSRQHLISPYEARRHQILTALRLECDVRVERIGMTFVLVPPGRSPETDIENPTAFFLAESPISQAQWVEVTGDGAAQANDDRAMVGVTRSQIGFFLERIQEIIGDEAAIELPRQEQLIFAWEVGRRGVDARLDLMAPTLKVQEPNALGLFDLTGVVYQLCRDPWRWWGGSFETSDSTFAITGEVPSWPSRSSFEAGPELGFRPVLRLHRGASSAH